MYIVILSWFIDKNIKDVALSRKRLIEEHEVEIRPECIPSSCLDENVYLPSIQKYFSEDAWLAVTNVVEIVKKNTSWYCGACSKAINDETEDSIHCESCLYWFHFTCVAIKTAPKKKEWFCRQCHAP